MTLVATSMEVQGNLAKARLPFTYPRPQFPVHTAPPSGAPSLLLQLTPTKEKAAKLKPAVNLPPSLYAACQRVIIGTGKLHIPNRHPVGGASWPKNMMSSWWEPVMRP